MRQYTFDINNRYTGFLDSDIFVESSTTVKPASSDHKLWNSDTESWDLSPVVELTLEDAKENRINQARDYFNEIIVGIEEDSADFEPATWEVQRSEWNHYVQSGIVLKISGDETAVIDNYEIITGLTTDTSGNVMSVSYDSVRDTTTVVVSVTSGIFEVGELITDGINTTTGAITRMVKLSPTPYCNILSEIRDIDIHVLMDRIGVKVKGIASVQGTLHKLEDVINACTTIDDVNNVGW